MEIRAASVHDLPAIVEIHNHHVLNGVATFDEVPATVEGRTEWFATFGRMGRYRLVVADDGGVRGFACSAPYRTHPAFAETVELSIYLDPSWTGRGLGTALYEHLLAELATEGLHRAVVGIALPNDASVALHRRFGFVEVGVFDEYATKWGRSISSIWMQRPL